MGRLSFLTLLYSVICNADIKSDLSWENMSGNFKLGSYFAEEGMESIMLLRKKNKKRKFLEAYSKRSNL